MSRDLPVRRCCVCGADCDWCVGTNKARRVLPRAVAKHDEVHDNPDEHYCVSCFEKAATHTARGELHK